MCRAWCAERGFEAVAGVGLGVIAHDRLDGSAALLAHPCNRTGEGHRDRVGVLDGVQLAVRELGVVVADADDDGVAQAAMRRVRSP